VSGNLGLKVVRGAGAQNDNHEISTQIQWLFFKVPNFL